MLLAMPSKTAVFVALVITQVCVLYMYHMNLVDKITASFNRSALRIQNSSHGFGKYFKWLNRIERTHDTSDGFNLKWLENIANSIKNILVRCYDKISSAEDDIIELFRGVTKNRNATTVPLGGYQGTSIRDRPFGPVLVERPFLLTLITTHPKSIERRRVIRKTWAGTINSKYKTGLPAKSTNVSPTYPDSTIYCIFTVGFSYDVALDRQIERESYRYGDIIRINKKETYRNLVHKIHGSFKWAISAKPQYILKADDDVYVNMPKLISWLHSPRIPPRLYAGFVHYRGFINRDPAHRWFISRSEFPEGQFPPYCAGPFYLFSGNILTKIHLASLRQKRFAVEDAYFGVLARSIGIHPFNAGGTAWFWDGGLDLRSSSWTNSRLKRLAVIGDGMDVKGIQYLHDRYKRIRQN